ncbi:MAG: pyridoxal phosphate-dependent aminotransferase [Desulfomonile tiedjei]|uniref:Aminotransferase n=1 Tax=Desulfomonile tiedjei TaxID=2358 RepID=A0A9D6V208_9BACT|nr:pyridoxal phosphate-dependent aminotransferase [Desulfomonile tiedjei]
MPVASRIAQFTEESYWVRRMFEEGSRLKKEHGAHNVFDFSLGNPDLDPVKAVKDSILEAAGVNTPGIHGYTPHAGLPELRAAVAEMIQKDEGIAVDENSIVMTAGATGALNVAIRTVVNPGDEVIILVPYFCEYPYYIDNHGGRAIKVPTLADFLPDLGAIDASITPRTAAILITSPNNPTGRVYNEQVIRGLADLLIYRSSQIGRPIVLIADEPYKVITFDGVRVPSILQAYPNSMTVSSFGKSHSIPGERLGYIAMSPGMNDAARTMDGLILSNRILGFVHAPALAQRAARRVLRDIIDVSVYQRRRDRFYQALSDFGYELIWPEGAFYFFPKTPLPDDATFVELLKKRLILTVPGTGYGMPGHFRIAYCVPDETIEGSLRGFEDAIDEARAVPSGKMARRM